LKREPKSAKLKLYISVPGIALIFSTVNALGKSK